MADKVIPVKVALRCRPLVSKEIEEGCQTCLQFFGDTQQIVIGANRTFLFDFLFTPTSHQTEIYNSSVTPLIENIFKGYNATILAYGQTGSGKTYTMGTCYSKSNSNENSIGIIPRVINDIFNGINSRNFEFLVKVTFLEIYNEEVLDLLNPSRQKDDVVIREDVNGEIKVNNLIEIVVTSAEQTMNCLEQGSLSRSTGSTAMNRQSSRSHAIFTIHIEQKEGENFTKSKFHLVDLAGSERAKKTQAQGERFKEGVNINRGLLALGNVISALCEEGTRCHVPYRDSKLTRLLQDSLGGNSHTLMIACISPADSNLEETVNTLRYACRARKIKNKPIVNLDPQAAELARLKQMIQHLQLQLLQEQTIDNSDMGSQLKNIIERNKVLEVENRKLTQELQLSNRQITNMYEKALLAETARDKLKQQLEQLRLETGLAVEFLNDTLDPTQKLQLSRVKELEEKVIKIKGEQEEIKFYPEENLDEVNSNDKNSDGLDLTSDEVCVQHALRQAEMNRELQNLTHALAMKQELANKMMMNDDNITTLKNQYQDNMKQLEEEIALLQKEKEELQSSIKSFQNNPSNKISEQRRKRVQELESQISQLKKKIQEQTRLIKLKEQNDSKITKLQQEIQTMKQMRVKMVKQLREESEKFRHWKQQKDCEIAKLKQQDRRRQYQVIKMEQNYAKQQNVMRRKMEEAVAAHKRLKETMALRVDRRLETKDKQSANAISRIQNWIEQELKMVVSLQEASHHLNNLLEDRKLISEQIKELEKQCNSDEDEPPCKKSSLSDEETNNSPKSINIKNKNQQTLHMLKNELELRNIQISDLQQKLMDVDEEDKAKKRWENIQAMIEAKHGLEWLFDACVKYKLQNAIQKSSYKELKIEYEEAQKTLKEMQEKIKCIQQSHLEETLQLEQEREEKVLFLLRQLQRDPKGKEELDVNVRSQLKYQEEEIYRLSNIHEEFQQKKQECEELKKELSLIHDKANKASLLPEICSLDGAAILHAKRRKTIKNRNTIEKPTAILDDIIAEDEDDLEDNKDIDPDWHETPLAKHRRKKPQKKSKSDTENSTDENKEKQSLGPLSENLRCKCKGACKSKQCSCQKIEKSCTDRCGCDISRCSNRLQDQENSSPEMNSTYYVNDRNNSLQGILTENNRDKTPNQKQSPIDELNSTYVTERLKRERTNGQLTSFFEDIKP